MRGVCKERRKLVLLERWCVLVQIRKEEGLLEVDMPFACENYSKWDISSPPDPMDTLNTALAHLKKASVDMLRALYQK